STRRKIRCRPSSGAGGETPLQRGSFLELASFAEILRQGAYIVECLRVFRSICSLVDGQGPAVVLFRARKIASSAESVTENPGRNGDARMIFAQRLFQNRDRFRNERNG